uniref:Uncharacterized protein n=1 Tax=Tanacetum cinerariifolium TaxID=118510 RepID=A0A6L2LG82_TANCI|nr:hypothetical protein [Tanacetum cinerariifolium]
MVLTFVDTHNMITHLTKSDASEGFDQIINFLNASSIKYALTLTRKKVIITEATIRDALRLDDAESIDCLPNEEIFTKLSRMGGRHGMSLVPLWLQLSSAFQQVGKGFFGVDTPLFEGMIVAQQDNDIADEVQALPSTSQVHPTLPPSPIAQPPSPQQQPQPSHDVEISMDLLYTLLETCTTLTRRVEHLEQDKIAQSLEIKKLKQRVMKLERRNKLKGRIIASMDADKDVTLKDVADIAKEVAIDAEIEDSADDDELEPAELQEVVEVVTTAKLMTKVVIAASATITAAATLIYVATITPAPSTARRRKGVVIRDPEENATPSIIIHSEPKSKDKGKGILVEEPKPLKKQAQIKQDEAYARELEAELNKTIN